MKAATIWVAISLTALTSFGLGIALGGQTDFARPAIAKFFSEWQTLIGAVTAIFAVAATLQAGWWALSGPREQIEATKNEAITQAENKYRAVRAITLINLNKIVRFCIESLRYIYGNINFAGHPSLDQNVIDNLALLVEANRPESNRHATSLIGKIQLVQSWVFDIHVEKEKVGNAVPIAALNCLLLYAECMKWFEFARGEADSIESDISYEDIKSAIRTLRVANNLDLPHDEFQYRELIREIRMHFHEFDSEGEPSESVHHAVDL